MKCIIDIPDKYVDMCKGLFNFFCDVDEVDVDDIKMLEDLKGRDVNLDLKAIGSEKAKELSIALVMVVCHQEYTKKEGED